MMTGREAAKHWARLAKDEREMAAWVKEHVGGDVSANLCRAESYERTARKLRGEEGDREGES